MTNLRLSQGPLVGRLGPANTTTESVTIVMVEVAVAAVVRIAINKYRDRDTK